VEGQATGSRRSSCGVRNNFKKFTRLLPAVVVNEANSGWAITVV